MIVILWCVLREQNSGLVQETNVFHLILPLPCLFASTPRCYTIHYIKSYSEFLITEVNHVISLLKSLQRFPIVLTSPSYTDLISYNPWCCPLWLPFLCQPKMSPDFASVPGEGGIAPVENPWCRAKRNALSHPPLFFGTSICCPDTFRVPWRHSVQVEALSLFFF